MATSSTDTLGERMAALEERMNTKQQEYKTDIARLAEDMAKRDTDAAKRETHMLFAVIGVMALGIAILGFMQSGAGTP